MSNKLLCHNCGASIDKDSPKCPYCGELNYSGAEKEYMEHLTDIKDNLESLSKESDNEVLEEIANVGRTLKRSLIIIGIIIFFFGSIVLLGVIIDKSSEKVIESTGYHVVTNKEKVIWLAEYEEKLNALYDEGNYDEILEIAKEQEDSSVSGYKAWRHHDFIEYYGYYNNYCSYLERTSLDKYNLADMLYDVLMLENYKEYNYKQFSKEEVEMLDGYAEELHGFYKEYLGLNEDDIEEVRQRICYANGSFYVSSSECRRYLESVME